MDVKGECIVVGGECGGCGFIHGLSLSGFVCDLCCGWVFCAFEKADIYFVSTSDFCAFSRP